MLTTALAMVGLLVVGHRASASSDTLADSAKREAVRVGQTDPMRSDPWTRLRRVAPGDVLLVTTTNHIAAERRLISAERDTLTLLNLKVPSLTERARTLLLQLTTAYAFRWEAVFRGQRLQLGALEVSLQDGVLVHGQRVADVDDVVERIAEPDVVLVTTPPVRHASVIKTSVAVGSTAVVGWATALGLATSGACTHCAWRSAGEWALQVGLPIGSGIATYYATSRMTEDVLYQW